MRALHWTSRLEAAGVHLAVSAAVAAAAAALVFGFWFPGYFSTLAGGQGIFVLITSVDIAMGPLITLCIFERTKARQELVRDLSIVAFLQFAALCYGLHTMYVARPVVMALEVNRFRVVSANDVLISELPLAQPGFQSLSLTGPRFVGVAPSNPKEQMAEMNMAGKGYDLGARPKYWRDWENTGRPQAIGESRPIEQLAKRYPARQGELNAALAKTGVPLDQLRFLPIVSLHATAVALVDIRSGNIVGYAPFDGFI
jgi:hypothetical protein